MSFGFAARRCLRPTIPECETPSSCAEDRPSPNPSRRISLLGQATVGQEHGRVVYSSQPMWIIRRAVQSHLCCIRLHSGGHKVSQEAEVYCILQSIQGSAVPVFLGLIDLAKIYFLHGAGEIRHMLLMSWGGKSLRHEDIDTKMQRHISRSKRSILSLGVMHDDLRPENILWNENLKRVLIIDFHRCHLTPQLLQPKPNSSKKRRLDSMHGGRAELRTKRMCVT
ncbi:uncharacterized protein BO97DRAFT_448963 [Aspergillus homomorphus CBS 101889]|uniref:Protein kinase domain-containing protein n=1 Tax=Aspergillus homomorphus (strain CBS 101889) TaxID=1450537 RepID=A0A395HFD7_ASPHC|nr:hypothetical protein BO97DRAFT_448963 [Aspergillus homomorphus CBS 101889]RAL06612.1 hypothetical protein BO97DRAFT_448963 [Aspergillus homomorphus CBS 101889]